MSKIRLTPDTAPSPEILTRREFKILQMISLGVRNADIAENLEISERTVECHRMRMMKKIKLYTVPDLVFYCIKYGIIDPTGKPTNKFWASY